MSDLPAHELYEPDADDLDAMTRAQLAELGMPGDVAAVIDDWLLAEHGVTSSRPFVGSFLERLAAAGYRVTPIDPGPPFEALLPASPD